MKELAIPLKADNKIPLYEQIYEYIKRDITDGKISPGEKLPSTRLLAKYLQVSRSTVDMAYDQLLSEGYVETVPCSGYFVCAIETGFPGPDRRKENVGRGLGRLNVMDSDDGNDWDYAYDFSPNAIEWPEFSMNAWRKATKSMLQEEMGELFQS